MDKIKFLKADKELKRLLMEKPKRWTGLLTEPCDER